jgi:hypothetical protein
LRIARHASSSDQKGAATNPLSCESLPVLRVRLAFSTGSAKPRVYCGLLLHVGPLPAAPLPFHSPCDQSGMSEQKVS